jgi:hypothetical protein
VIEIASPGDTICPTFLFNTSHFTLSFSVTLVKHHHLGTSTFWNPMGLSRPLMGLLYLYLYLYLTSIFKTTSVSYSLILMSVFFSNFLETHIYHYNKDQQNALFTVSFNRIINLYMLRTGLLLIIRRYYSV